MNSPDINDYLRLFAQYGRHGGALGRGFEAHGDMRLLFAQIMALLNRASRFNRGLPPAILLLAQQLYRDSAMVKEYFRCAENRRFFLNDLYRYLDVKGRAAVYGRRYESPGNAGRTWQL